MGRFILAFVLSFSLALAVAGAQSKMTNVTVAYANQTVSSAAYFLTQVNESGYLLFNPNLTQAYSDLSRAESLYNTSPASAVVFANKAVNEANGEYLRISNYRCESVVAMAALTVFFALLLGRIARPITKKGKQRKMKAARG